MDHAFEVVSWQRSVRLVKRVRGKEGWLLAASPNLKQPRHLYEEYCAIEKLFRNTKSGSFDLEKLLGTKYDRLSPVWRMSSL